MSNGSLLLMSGAPGKRLALPDAKTVIHQPSGGFQGQSTDVEIHAREIRELRRRIDELYARHTGRRVGRVHDDNGPRPVLHGGGGRGLRLDRPGDPHAPGRPARFGLGWTLESARGALLTPQPEFTVDVRREGDVVVLAPRGEIDLSTVGQLRAALDGHEHENLVLDLKDVEFLDSSGLTLILELHRRAEETGSGFVLGQGPRAVQRIFEMTGLTHRLRFVDHAGRTGTDAQPETP
jgi:anti-anti-sigma factor